MINSFFLASSNKHKYEEMLKIFDDSGIKLVCPEQLGIKFYAEENGSTFEQNALIKARTAYEISGLASIADDSGLCIDALDGRPGIFSARYADSDEACIRKVLSELRDVPHDRRGAEFVCAIACVIDSEHEFCVTGKCRGFISDSPCGENGFGYDPIFICPEYNQTFGQLSAEIKNKISHRAAALAAFSAKLAGLNI